MVGGWSSNFGRAAQTTLGKADMYVKGMVEVCNFTDAKYDPPVDGACLVQRGSSRRWCTVMYAGPDYLERRGIVPFTYEEAIEEIKIKGEPDDRAKFFRQ